MERVYWRSQRQRWEDFIGAVKLRKEENFGIDERHLKLIFTEILAAIKEHEEYDMKINVKKTKVMIVCMNGSKREGGNSI